MSDDNGKTQTEVVVEGFFGKLKELFAETLGEVVTAINKDAKLDAPAKPKLGVVQGGASGSADPEAKTDPPPAGTNETPPTNVRQMRTVTT